MSLLLFFRGCFCAGEMDSGAVKGLALAFEMDFWGVPKFMNSGFRTVGILSRCSEIMIKIGYGKWTTPTQVTYTRRELYLFNKLGELTGANESLFFEWLRSCGVVSPWQLCLHSLQDVYRRVSGVCLSHSVRLRLEGNISATFAAQLCHQHVPETERPDL